MFEALRTLVRDLNFVTHSVPATVTLPEPDDPIETTGIWLPPLVEEQPFGTDLRRREPRRVMALPRDATLTQVPPRGTLILAAEYLGTDAPVRSWRVDGTQSHDADHFRVILVPVPEEL